MILSCGGVGQSGIGLEDQGPVCPVAEFLDQRQQFFRAEAAVKTHGVHAEAAECQTHGRHCGSEEGPARGFKGHGHPDGEMCVLLGGKNSRLDLIQVAHGFDDHEVRTGLFAADQDFAEGFIRIFKAQRAKGFQQLPERADVQGNLYVPVAACHTGTAHAALHQFRHAAAAAGSLESVDSEGVGVENPASGFDIFSLDFGDFFRLRAVPQFRDLPDRQPRRLQHGSHPAVQDNQFTVFHSFSRPSDRHSRQTSYRFRSPCSVLAAGGRKLRSAPSRSSAAPSGRSPTG